MWRSLLSEWIKLRRPAMLLGGAGAIVGFAAVTVALTLNSVAEGPAEGFTLDQIVAANGLARTVASAAQFIGVVALALFAISIAGEYTLRTLRNLLVRQPRRVRLLAGKLLALASFTAVAVVLGEVAAVLTALVVAPSQDIATAAWFTGDGWAPGWATYCWPPLAGACWARCWRCCCARRRPRSAPGWPTRSRSSCWSPAPGSQASPGCLGNCWARWPRAGRSR
jgi:ABC-2 family transporter protein